LRRHPDAQAFNGTRRTMGNRCGDQRNFARQKLDNARLALDFRTSGKL
jgi:hypothetical protein